MIQTKNRFTPGRKRREGGRRLLFALERMQLRVFPVVIIEMVIKKLKFKLLKKEKGMTRLLSKLSYEV